MLRVVAAAYRDLLDVLLTMTVASSVYAAIGLPVYVAIASRPLQALADRIVRPRAAGAT
jgi:hypothetical protein